MDDKLFLDLRDPKGASEKMQPLFDAVNGESPLPCALLCAAYIDKCLKGMLETIFIKSQHAEKIIKIEAGVLGSLFARARLLYLMEKIDRVSLENISIIGQIRNLFAHEPEPLTFESPKIAKLCKDLAFRNPDVVISNLEPKGEEHLLRINNEPRNKFTTVAMTTVIFLLHASLAIATNKTPSGNPSVTLSVEK